jgi:hypothetical protein
MFSTIKRVTALRSTEARELDEHGFVVLPGPMPAAEMDRVSRAYDGQVLATGPTGSLIVFNGSVWHGHTANRSGAARRSVQGAFIPRDGCSATDFLGRMRPETRAPLGRLAQYVLAL